MAESIIPKRPSNDGEYSAIKANDRDCLSYAVAFNVPNERAFALFHPEFLDESGKLTKVGKQQCRQFFSYAKNKEEARVRRAGFYRIQQQFRPGGIEGFRRGGKETRCAQR